MKRIILTLVSIVCLCAVVSANYRYIGWDFVCKEGGEVVGRMHFSPSDAQNGTVRVEYRGEVISGRYEMERPVSKGESVPITYYSSDGRQTRGDHVWALNGDRLVSIDGLCFYPIGR